VSRPTVPRWVPILVLFLLLQKKIVSGITAGALK
jgi:ABC-type maltose transport system permease subunit